MRLKQFKFFILVLQVFAAFCGLGIHNVMNYETIQKSNAKQRVALEVQS